MGSSFSTPLRIYQASWVPFDCSSDNTVTIEDANCVSIEALEELLGVLDPVSIKGDANGDGRVTFGDFLVLSQNFGGSGGYTDGDFDLSGSIQFPDFLILSSNFGQSGASATVVPEPSSCPVVLSLLTLAIFYYRETVRVLR